MGIQNRFQYYSDKLKPQFGYRWITTSVLACFHAIRVYLHGYYCVTFMLVMLLMVAVVIFLTSRIDGSDPDLAVPSDGLPLLPIKASDKLRPFVPILPEFRFWCIVNIVLCVALGMTFIPRLNIPGPWYIFVGLWLLMVDQVQIFPFLLRGQENGRKWGNTKGNNLPLMERGGNWERDGEPSSI